MVYQIYPRSFSDSDGDGVGDLGGVLTRLDYLRLLGVDVVWISPIYPTPMDDNGYDISDYRDIDPVFGDLDVFDEVVAGIHQRGMRLVIDLVVNHTSDEHPWFVESRSDKNGPKRDWYWWRAQPNNWGSFFSGSAWEHDQATGEYYLHLFSRKQPDLNWENTEVRHEVYDMMRWWLARGVDGFRMDVINFISKVTDLPDGKVRAGEQHGDGTPYFFSGPRIHEYLREMHEQVFSDHDGQLLVVGEMPGVSVEDAVMFTDPARQEVDMVFQFEHMEVDTGHGKYDVAPFSLPRLKESLGRWQDGLAEVGWNSLYWNNHDQPRAVSRFGDDGTFRERSAKLLGTVLHLHRGTPYVYQGEELAMTNTVFDGIENFRDIEAVNFYAEATSLGRSPYDVLAVLRSRGRDNARTPMQWDSSPHAGFTSGSPWIEVNPNYKEVNADSQIADQSSVFHYYRRLIELRHREPVVARGDFTMLLPDDPNVYAFTRRLDDVELLVLANFSSHHVSAEVPDAEAWLSSELLLTNLDQGSRGAATQLAPWEARVHRRLADPGHPAYQEPTNPDANCGLERHA